MADSPKIAAEKSRKRFDKFVKPLLEKVLNAKILPVEREDIEVLRRLDMKSSIDYVVVDSTGSRGLSSRVQDDDNFYITYRTFTIRNIRQSGIPTELKKIQTAKSNGYVYPYWIVQAYTSGDNCLNRFAIAKWDDALNLIANGNSTWVHTGEEQIGQASFFALRWSEFTKSNMYLYIFENIQNTVTVPSSIHWPDWNEPYHPTWTREILELWVKNNMGSKDQLARYKKDLAWYNENK